MHHSGSIDSSGCCCRFCCLVWTLVVLVHHPTDLTLSDRKEVHEYKEPADSTSRQVETRAYSFDDFFRSFVFLFCLSDIIVYATDCHKLFCFVLLPLAFSLALSGAAGPSHHWGLLLQPSRLSGRGEGKLRPGVLFFCRCSADHASTF